MGVVFLSFGEGNYNLEKGKAKMNSSVVMELER